MTGTGISRELQCPRAKRLFSPYLDGAVTGTEMLALQQHLLDCGACNHEYQALRRTQQLLMSVGRPKVPADLGLKLRLAISREVEPARRARFEGWKVRLEKYVPGVYGSGHGRFFECTDNFWHCDGVFCGAVGAARG